MATIQIYKFNNYFNRKLILTEPEDAPLYVETNYNFNPNDGVNTTTLVGKAGNPYADTGDYVYVEDEESESHWFILESTRNRKGQYTLLLRRDLMRDYYPQWTTSTAYISKATVPESSTYIYNQEPFTSNQIKLSETALKDSSKLAWIIGFVSQSMQEDIPVEVKSAVVPDYVYATEEECPYFNRSYKVPVAYNSSALQVWSKVSMGTTKPYTPYTWTNFSSRSVGSSSSVPLNIFYVYESEYMDDINNLMKEWGSAWRQIAESFYDFDCGQASGYTSYNTVTRDITSQKGKVVAIGTPETGYQYYKLGYAETTITDTVETAEGMELYGNVWGFLKSIPYIEGTQLGLTYNIQAVQYTSTRQRLYSTTSKVTIPKYSSRLNNKQAPFDIFCIPYSEELTITGVYGEQEITVSANATFALTAASEIGKGLSTNCYDIQLLPYCPMTGFVVSGNNFNINSADPLRQTWVLSEENQPIYPIFWSTSNSGTFNIEQAIPVKNKKISNQLDTYRLVSPNYNGQFEFSPAMNGGVDYIDVDYTYLPYSSYIHLNPNFKNLYGSDFNDARGLICQGDFSIMYLSDAWIDYQVQNKNYNNIFDRETQSLQVQHKYERIQSAISAGASALGTGVTAGVATGNIVAGLATGVASAVGGVADFGVSEKLYQNQMSTRKDIFDYQLDNIKALPNSIAKTTAYTENNKIFPVLEYYSCGEEQTRAFANMIANQGMTLGVIDQPINYLENTFNYENIEDRGFMQLSLIDIDLDGDNHLIQELNSELQLGVYTK